MDPAGSDGRIDVAWYHTSSPSGTGPCPSGTGTCTLYGAANLNKAEWTVQLGQSLNAHAPSPAFSTADVTEAPIKYGQICTSGLGCVMGGDRSLGDFLQVTTDRQGAAGNGASRGVLKVRHGVILEVGVALRALTANRAADQRFFRTLRPL